MTKVLITGMSGTGKSSVIAELAARGYRAVDLDHHEWSEYQPMAMPKETFENDRDWVWREDAVERLLSSDETTSLFVSGCASNQGKFYARLDQIILLSAPVELLVDRLAKRTTNAYGKRPEEQQQVRYYQRTVEPLLRKSATAEIDTSAPLEDVVTAVLTLVDGPRTPADKR